MQGDGDSGGEKGDKWEELEEEKKKADVETEHLQQHLNKVWDRLSEHEQKQASRKAQRTLRQANRQLSRIKQFLGHHVEREEEEVESDEEQEGQEELEEEEEGGGGEGEYEYEEEEGEEEEEEERIKAKRVLKWWKRLLERVRELVEEGFYEVFEDVNKFLQSFRKQQNQLQLELNSQWHKEEVAQLLKDGERHFQRFTSASKRKNVRGATQAKEKLDNVTYTLQDMYSDDPEVASFLQKVELAVMELETESQMKVEMKEIEKQRRLDRYKKSIINLRKDVDETMRKLNATVDKNLQTTKADADETVASFKKHQKK